MNELAIGPGTQVTLHFSLKLTDGQMVDSNFEGEPAVFSVGDGNLLHGFEQALFGLKAGQRETFILDPEHSFGARNPDNVQRITRDQFPDDVDLEEGLMLSFADAQQAELPGVVTEFDDAVVTVDFNHPLAGRDIEFSVLILDVTPAVTH